MASARSIFHRIPRAIRPVAPLRASLTERALPLSFVKPAKVSNPLWRAHSCVPGRPLGPAIVPTPGLFGETHSRSANNIGLLKCFMQQKPSDIANDRARRQSHSTKPGLTGLAGHDTIPIAVEKRRSIVIGGFIL